MPKIFHDFLLGKTDEFAPKIENIPSNQKDLFLQFYVFRIKLILFSIHEDVDKVYLCPTLCKQIYIIRFINIIVFSRLLPTAPCIARVLESEFMYNDYQLPVGVNILMRYIYIMHIPIYIYMCVINITFSYFLFSKRASCCCTRGWRVWTKITS